MQKETQAFSCKNITTEVRNPALALKSDVLRDSLQLQNQILELPYKDGLLTGIGIDASSGNPRASPFQNPFEIPSLSDNISKETTQYNTISEFREFAEATVACAKASFKGWGAEVATNFAYNKSFSNKHNEILFVAQRKIEYPAQIIKKLPTLSVEAKKTLENDAEEFHKKYGDYVIVGYKRHASVTGIVKIFSGATTVDTTAVASLSAAWSGFGTSTEASAEYEKRLKSKSEFKLSEVKVICEGTDTATKIESTISGLKSLIAEFQDVVKNGGAIKCFLLWDYRMFEEYLTINSMNKLQIPRPLIGISDYSDHVILEFLRLKYLGDYFEALPSEDRLKIGDSFLHKIDNAKNTIKKAIETDGVYHGLVAEKLEKELLAAITPTFVQFSTNAFGGGGGTSFIQKKTLDYKTDSLWVVGTSGQLIDSIFLTVQKRNTALYYPGDHYYGGRGPRKFEYELNDLKRIIITYGELVDSVQFVTASGNSPRFGGSGPREEVIYVEDGMTLVGIHGAYGTFVNRLGFVFNKKS